MISTAHCFNHATRPAAAQCLECRRTFCRECVTEHTGRLMCAACLQKRGTTVTSGPGWRRRLALPVMAITAVLGSWFLFYAAGSWLEELTTPDIAPGIERL